MRNEPDRPSPKRKPAPLKIEACGTRALCGADFDKRSSQAKVCRKAPHNLKRGLQSDPYIGIGLHGICGPISYLFADATLPR
jgi:hypothetical protein